jgi:AcrR family transcriptional regulator
MKNDASTEEKIKAAAREVFLSKGFDGCTSREIAKAAGENVALVNYYFRSKGQLFQLVFQAVMEDFVHSMLPVFGSNQSLEEKMRIFIEHEYAFLMAHPELPSFILNEMKKEDGCSMAEKDLFQKVAETGIFAECMKAQQEGKMREISIPSIPLLIMSNCQFPIMARGLMKGMLDLTDDQYTQVLTEHEKIVVDMLVNYLFPKK